MARSMTVWACGALLFAGATWCDAYGPRRAVGVFPPPPENVTEWPTVDPGAPGRQIVFVRAALSPNSGMAALAVEPFAQELMRRSPSRHVRFTQCEVTGGHVGPAAERFREVVSNTPAAGSWQPLHYGGGFDGGVAWLIDGRPVASLSWAWSPDGKSDAVARLLTVTERAFGEPDGPPIAP